MAAQANLKSAAITALDATPPVRPTAGKEGGPTASWEVIGIVGPTTHGATTGGVLRACRIPSNAIVRSVQVAQVAATTTATFDIGLHYSTADGGAGAALDADFFASNVSTASLVVWTEEAFESGTYTVDEMVKPIWQAAGLSEDPGGWLDVTLSNTATIDGAATLVVRVHYVMSAQ